MKLFLYRERSSDSFPESEISQIFLNGGKLATMSNTIASHVLDAIRDHMRLHVGFCRWSDDVGGLWWVVSARDNDGQRWVSKHEDFYGTVCGPAKLAGFELEDG